MNHLMTSLGGRSPLPAGRGADRMLRLCKVNPRLRLSLIVRRQCRTMGDLAAGKKAAAVRAVNEWVKV